MGDGLREMSDPAAATLYLMAANEERGGSMDGGSQWDGGMRSFSWISGLLQCRNDGMGEDGGAVLVWDPAGFLWVPVGEGNGSQMEE